MTIANKPSASYYIDKHDVACSFGAAAESYNQAAVVQSQVGRQLLDDLVNKNANKAVGNIVDLGAGTGRQGELLSQEFPLASLIALDLSPSMLSFSRQQNNYQTYLCADAEQLPLTDGSVDLIYSNFVLQWCMNLQQAFSEAKRIMPNGGTFTFSLPAAGSLIELEKSWQTVDEHVHVNQFPEVSAIQSMLAKVGFSDVKIKTEDFVMEYESVTSILRALKAVGAHNINAGRPKGLMTRNKLIQLENAYGNFRLSNGALPVTYRVAQAVLIK